jgi:hypothetical protein
MYDFVATRLGNKNMLPLSNNLVTENIFRDKSFVAKQFGDGNILLSPNNW